MQIAHVHSLMHTYTNTYKQTNV